MDYYNNLNSPDYIFNVLENAYKNNDINLYRKTVDDNIDNIQDAINDYYLEDLFKHGSRKQIIFWLTYPNVDLLLSDILNLAPENEDLFQIAINKPNINMDTFKDDLYLLNERIEQEPNNNVRQLLLNRLNAVQNKINNISNNNNKIHRLTFDEAIFILSNNGFTRFDFLPQHQNNKRYPNTYIGTFFDKDGQMYLVELKYKQDTNEILPPI